MAIEAQRGCGYRKVGGLYLCGEGITITCDRLPYELVVCPTCGEGVKFSRGFRWLNWTKYAGIHEGCSDILADCPVCTPITQPQPYGLLFVGESFYTPQSFIEEALKMGVSKRIPAPPRNLKLGETWVLFAHKHVVEPPDTGEQLEDLIAQGQAGIADKKLPGVFYAFRPQRLEFLIWKSQATPEYLAELEKKKFTPIIIPDGDVDHDPRTSLKPTLEEKDKLLFDNLRQSLRSMA
jgi:hypothetical protein